MITNRHPYGSPPARRWGVVSWWFSLLLVIPFVGIVLTVVWMLFLSGSNVEGRVFDAYTGEGIANAQIQLGDRQTESGSDGRFGIRNSDFDVVTVTVDGYESVTYQIPAFNEANNPGAIEIGLRPTTLSGIVTHRVNDEPMAGVVVEAIVNGSPASSTETSSDGSYLLTDIPEGAEIRFSYQDYAQVMEPIDQRAEISLSMRPGFLAGRIVDESGQPIRGASIAIADAWTTSGEDGSFRLENAPETGEVFFKAPGYHALSRPLDDQLNVDVTMQEKHIRAIYVTAGAVGNEAKFNQLLDLVERTEINAMVIDVKDSTGLIFYDTQVELARELGVVRPQYDVREVLAELQERGIYTIARQVIFEDPMLAEARHDLAIRDSEGGLWRTWNGIAWLSAYEEEVWDYNIEIMMEAVELGFDEIQLDYMRFPSDGPLNRAVYNSPEHTTETRAAAIAEYLRRSHEAIMPTRAYLAGDIFGLALWELGDGGIGQNLEAMTPHLDYIAPMIYPSHFYPGSMGFDVPNDHPYEVILYSLQNGASRIPDDTAKLRPWLQDFSFGPGISYGPAEVRAQIDASDDFGATGWMLWSASNVYQEDALRPASDQD